MSLLRKSLCGLVMFASVVSVAQAEPVTFKVDPVHSTVLFRIMHLNIAPAYGRFADPTGTFVLDSTDMSKSSFDISIDVAKVNTDNTKRDEHLRGPDFFSVQQFPTATFKSTSVKSAGEGKMEVSGELTLRGVTKPVSLTLVKTGEGDRGARFGYRAGLEGTVTIKRSDFGITYMPEGLGDDVQLTIALEGTK
jgi:polyisoprenoid-binding protein YceI